MIVQFEEGKTYRHATEPVSWWTVIKRTPKYVTLENKDGERVCKIIRRLLAGAGIVEGAWPKGRQTSPIMADLEVDVGP